MNIAISGTGVAGFSVPSSTLEVPEGTSGNLSVTFEPKSAGRFAANLTFNSNQVGASPVSIPLEGYGVQPAFTVDSSLRDFGEQRVNLERKQALLDLDRRDPVALSSPPAAMIPAY